MVMKVEHYFPSCVINLCVISSMSFMKHLTADAVLPEASQEGMLHPYKSYADVTLFHYYVPSEISRATWEFAAFMDKEYCPVREVHIWLQHGSYPLINPNNMSYPENLYVSRTALRSIVIHSVYQPHDATVFPVYNPLPGNWFVAAYLPLWDEHVIQEGIGHKCHYSLGSVALWSRVEGIKLLNIGSPQMVITLETLSYFKFFVPSGVWQMHIRIWNCRVRLRDVTATPLCIRGVYVKARALPTYNTSIAVEGIAEGEVKLVEEVQPFTNSYYYILITSEVRVQFEIEITTKECSFDVLGRNFAKQFTRITESLGRVSTSHSNSSLRSHWSGTVQYSNSSEVQKSVIYGLDSEKDRCLPVYQLARIKHAQDFSDTFLLQGREWFTTWIALTDYIPVITDLELVPFVDIGGTLSINIHLDELLINATHQLLTVKACIRKGRAPSRYKGNILCDPSLMLNVSSGGLETVDATKLIPFPEPDIWFIAFQAKCILNGTVVPCALEEVMVSLDIRTQPCVFTGDPCGPKGICQVTHKNLYFFTSCTCVGGWGGWGCSDGRNAVPESTLLATTLLLSLSNAFFLPVILLALRRRLLAQALVYLATMVFSCLYHACDQEIYSFCMTKYEVLQFCDFFCSILAFWVTLIALADLTPQFTAALHMLGVLVIAVGVEYNRTGLLVFIVPFGLGVSVPLCIWLEKCWRQRACVLAERYWVLRMLLGVVLAFGGLLLFALVETGQNYQYVHSAWHIVIALSLVFLLPQNKLEAERESHLDEAELCDVNDYYSSSPVFVVTSDLDNLMTDQT